MRAAAGVPGVKPEWLWATLALSISPSGLMPGCGRYHGESVRSDRGKWGDEPADANGGRTFGRGSLPWQ